MTRSSDTMRCKANSQAVRKLFADRCQDLLDAAGLLGGAAAQRRCLRLCSRLRSASRMDCHCRQELRWMHALLCLQIVDHPDSAGATHFCNLSPDDPAVHDLCLLAEALGDLLAEIDSEQAKAVSEKTLDAGLTAA